MKAKEKKEEARIRKTQAVFWILNMIVAIVYTIPTYLTVPCNGLPEGSQVQPSYERWNNGGNYTIKCSDNIPIGMAAFYVVGSPIIHTIMITVWTIQLALNIVNSPVKIR